VIKEIAASSTVAAVFNRHALSPYPLTIPLPVCIHSR
jgi:hypothetical protein